MSHLPCGGELQDNLFLSFPQHYHTILAINCVHTSNWITHLHPTLQIDGQNDNFQTMHKVGGLWVCSSRQNGCPAHESMHHCYEEIVISTSHLQSEFQVGEHNACMDCYFELKKQKHDYIIIAIAFSSMPNILSSKFNS